jgi:hypothetical protein
MTQGLHQSTPSIKGKELAGVNWQFVILTATFLFETPKITFSTVVEITCSFFVLFENGGRRGYIFISTLYFQLLFGIIGIYF